ncbi:MAG: DUF1848 domain-containing protein [bacterium]
MIISVSRRTDIPAFYSEWFYKRIEEGFCTVPNPFNAEQVSIVNLKPEAVTAFVFWTRNAYPLMKKLELLDEHNYKYYFQFTINNLPKNYEPYNPTLKTAIECFKELSNKLGSGKVIWRYDPIFFTDDITLKFHKENFECLYHELKGYTKRLVISIVDDYKKALHRLAKLDTNYKGNQIAKPQVEELLKFIVEYANDAGIQVESCAEEKDFQSLGIVHGKCVDDRLLKNEFGIDLTYKKDKGQRLPCGCMISKDIGMNNTCLMGCEYCYATASHELAVNNRKKHDPEFSSLLVHKMPKEIEKGIQELTQNKNITMQQMVLF